MRRLKLDKWTVQILVLIIILLSTVDRGRSVRRQCHVQTNKQTYMEMVCDTLKINYNKDYFGMNVSTQGPLYHILDTPVAKHSYTGKSNDTLPAGLHIDQSSIRFAGFGVFTSKYLPILTTFGPYRGAIIPRANQNESTFVYAWEIRLDLVYHHLVDGGDEAQSNWMRYMNSANIKTETNMKPYQSKGAIYYRTIKNIPACGELLVWYGDKYGKYLAGLREFLEEEYDEEKKRKNQ